LCFSRLSLSLLLSEPPNCFTAPFYLPDDSPASLLSCYPAHMSRCSPASLLSCYPAHMSRCSPASLLSCYTAHLPTHPACPVASSARKLRRSTAARTPLHRSRQRQRLTKRSRPASK
jgi:hypothetical protein